VREARPEPTPSPPITSDPPHHKPYKQLLLPSFTAEATTRLEPKTRQICNELINKFIAEGHCDAAQQYTRYIPVKVITHMLACRKPTATSSSSGSTRYSSSVSLTTWC
jgi:cytochrome P450